jgi:hypothetical protein
MPAAFIPSIQSSPSFAHLRGGSAALNRLQASGPIAPRFRTPPGLYAVGPMPATGLHTAGPVPLPGQMRDRGCHPPSPRPRWQRRCSFGQLSDASARDGGGWWLCPALRYGTTGGWGNPSRCQNLGVKFVAYWVWPPPPFTPAAFPHLFVAPSN